MKTRTKFAIGLVCALVSATFIVGQGPSERVIVTLNAGTDPAAAATSAAAHGAVITHVLHQGYSGILPSRLISDLRSDSGVSGIEPDQMVWVAQQQCVNQSPVPDWGLSRICQRALPLNFDDYQYEFDGSKVNVYVLDTGIDRTNSDFGGRATLGVDEIDGAKDGTKLDCNGHGTAVAGTIGGTKFGVAKKVSLTDVRVLNCGGVGFNSDVVAGLEWATDNYLSNRKPAVAVLGFEGPFSKALNAAVNAAYQAGLGSIVPAGNDHDDACNYSPASATGVLTVAATDITDQRASFSNGGTCVGIFAPGVNIASDWLRGETRSLSGTSISAAFVAGAAALALDEHPTWTFDQVTQHLNASATKGVINEPSDDCKATGPFPKRCAPPSPNALLFSACDI
jgi:subtilisin family serine protease